MGSLWINDNIFEENKSNTVILSEGEGRGREGEGGRERQRGRLRKHVTPLVFVVVCFFFLLAVPFTKLQGGLRGLKRIRKV